MAKIATASAKNGALRQTNPQNARPALDLAEVQKLAYQFFVERGCEHGHDSEDWLRAESVVRNRKKS